MTCYIHPDREDNWTCEACGKPICPECKVTLLGHTYCNPCAEKMYLAATKRKNWFEQHLNWTTVISLSATVILTFIAGIVVVAINPEITEENMLAEIQIAGSLIFYLIMFPVSSWVVRKKNRNPWNVFWLVMPFGWVMILLLSNMSQPPQSAKENLRPL